MPSAGKQAPRHGRKIEARVVEHAPLRLTWHVIECKCGWSSPLCVKAEKARKLYDAHRRKRA